MSRTATAVWRISPVIVLALDEHLGLPVDSYLNGTQTWLVEAESPEATFEWRLHPTAGFRTPAGMSHYDVWERVVTILGTGAGEDSLALGDETRTLRSLWDGLECFVPYGDDLEPAVLAHAATDRLGVAPDSVGLVDHDRIGAEWERADGAVSIVEMLLAELNTAGG
ncbi:MAG: hypothetical protein ABW211_00430 [Acidimicrobiia bacterium]